MQLITNKINKRTLNTHLGIRQEVIWIKTTHSQFLTTLSHTLLKKIVNINLL